MGYKVTGLAKRMRERNLRKSYGRAMAIYENTLDVMVGQDPRTTNPNKEVERDFNLRGGEVYGIKCPDDERYYRTAFVKVNPFTQQPQVMMSNPQYGILPDGIREISAQHLMQQMKLPNLGSFKAFGQTDITKGLDDAYKNWSNDNE